MHALEEQSVLEVSRRLSADGWTQTDYEEPAFAKQGTEDVVFRVRLNQSAKDYGVGSFPALGVRHLEVSRVVAQLSGLQPAVGEHVTSFGCGLADLLYRQGHEAAPFTRWLIRESSEISDVVTLLCEDIQVYATPFFHSLSTLDAIIDRLDQEKRYHAQSGHLAVANALTGRVRGRWKCWPSTRKKLRRRGPRCPLSPGDSLSLLLITSESTNLRSHFRWESKAGRLPCGWPGMCHSDVNSQFLDGHVTCGRRQLGG